MSGTDAVGFVILTLQFRKEGQYWLGECEELGTATDGRSLEKVRAELQRLVILHLSALEEAGERGRFFRENDIFLYTDHVPTVVERSVPVSDDGDTLVEARTIAVPLRSPEVIGV